MRKSGLIKLILLTLQLNTYTLAPLDYSMRQEAQRGLNREFDTFIDGLYGPITREAFKTNTRTASGSQEVDLPLSRLAQMYSGESAFQNAEEMLARHGASMTREAIELASTLVWIKKYGVDQNNPHTDYLRIGQDRIICFQDRVVEGISLRVYQGSSRAGSEIIGLAKKEKSKSTAVFKLHELAGRGNYSTWQLESARLSITKKSGEEESFVVDCSEGETDYMTGTQFNINVKSADTTQAETVAAWSGKVDLKRHTTERKIAVSMLKNVPSPSGKWIVDIDVPYLSVPRIYQRRAKGARSASVELERFISEGVKFGRGVAGVNMQTEDGGEALNTLSATMDDFSRPGTLVNLDEYDITFKKDRNVGKARRTRKIVELKKAKLFLTTSGKSEPESAKHFKAGLSEVMDPLISVMEAREK